MLIFLKLIFVKGWSFKACICQMSIFLKLAFVIFYNISLNVQPAEKKADNFDKFWGGDNLHSHGTAPCPKYSYFESQWGGGLEHNVVG